MIALMIRDTVIDLCRIPCFQRWFSRSRLMQSSNLLDRYMVIKNCIEYAEQACRYVAKHNECNMEEGPYKDGFLIACEICEKAIEDHIIRHLDRIMHD